MEQAKQSFLERYRKIKNAHAQLEQKERKLAEEMQSIYKKMQVPEENQVKADDLLNDTPESEMKLLKESFEGKKDQREAVLHRLESIKKQGGLPSLCKTDSELNETGEVLCKELLNQMKEDIKYREALEKRYEQVAKEIADLEIERLNFIKNGEQNLKLFNMLFHNTKVEVNYGKLALDYKFKLGFRYQQLGKAIKIQS